MALLDIGMPKITGYEAARRLRLRYGNDCPVLIAITGWKQASDKILALAGFDHHGQAHEPAQLVAPVSSNLSQYLIRSTRHVPQAE